MVDLPLCKLNSYLGMHLQYAKMHVWQNVYASKEKENMLWIHRGLPTGIYTTSTPEECHFVANDCKANIIVVEDQRQLDKILEVTLMILFTVPYT